MVLRVGVACVLLPLCAACVPFPNFDYHAPPIRGVVMRDGSPVEGAKLTLSADFTGENEITYSDKDGKFDLSAIREFRFTALLIGDPLYRYQVQIEYEGATYLGFGQASIGNPNELVTLSCDLNKPTKWMAETVYCKG